MNCFSCSNKYYNFKLGLIRICKFLMKNCYVFSGYVLELPVKDWNGGWDDPLLSDRAPFSPRTRSKIIVR